MDTIHCTSFEHLVRLSIWDVCKLLVGMKLKGGRIKVSMYEWPEAHCYHCLLKINDWKEGKSKWISELSPRRIHWIISLVTTVVTILFWLIW